MTEQSTQNQGDPGNKPDGTNPPPSTSLDSLLSNLDESARNAILGEVRNARSDAARYRTELRGIQDKAQKYDALVAEQQSAEQKAQEAQRRAEEKATAAVQRAVGAEIKAAAHGFADPADAVHFLDSAQYVDEKGDIDTRRIADDLNALLTSKPHLKRAVEGTRQPRPDASVSAGNNGNSAASDPALKLQAFFANQLGRG